MRRSRFYLPFSTKNKYTHAVFFSFRGFFRTALPLVAHCRIPVSPVTVRASCALTAVTPSILPQLLFPVLSLTPRGALPPLAHAAMGSLTSGVPQDVGGSGSKARPSKNIMVFCATMVSILLLGLMSHLHSTYYQVAYFAGSPETELGPADCLANTWIYIIGDSSMRMYTSALISMVNGTLEDRHFGHFLYHDKGNCTGEGDGHIGGGCLREYFNMEKRIRITFSFKTNATQTTLALDWLTSESQKPDALLLATGAWDFYGGRDVLTTVNNTVTWLQDMSARFPAATILFFNLVACHDAYKSQSIPFNDEIRSALSNISLPGLLLVDRQASTVNLNDTSLCEGWHAYGDIVLQHVVSSLPSICRPTL